MNDRPDEPFVSTGKLPGGERVHELLARAHERYGSADGGQVSQVYPALARVPEDLFGICVVAAGGAVFCAGDADRELNAGAIATSSLAPGGSVDEKWRVLARGLARFAGRDLGLDEEVYASAQGMDLLISSASA